jgi:hypothetical protein
VSYSKSTICTELELIDKLVFRTCGIELTNVNAELESQEYSAYTFQLDGRNVKFRVSKITPTKIGQFVTIWKRNENRVTAPISIYDDFDLYIIATRKDVRFGFFIFPKQVLHENGILSDKMKDGKRGVRVYPIWDVTTNKQAQKTQQWQVEYFTDLTNGSKSDIRRVKNLLSGDKKARD